MNLKPRLGEFIAGIIASALLWIAYIIALAIFHGADQGDWLSFAGAMLGTMMAIGGAVLVDRSKVASERRSSLREVVRASTEGVALFREARSRFKELKWKSDEAAMFGAEADQLNATIDRLLSRQQLTDGAINAGTGTMRLMQSIRKAADIFQQDDGLDFGERAFDILMESATVVEIVDTRLEDLRTYHQIPELESESSVSKSFPPKDKKPKSLFA